MGQSWGTNVFNENGQELSHDEINECIKNKVPVFKKTKLGKLCQICGAKKKDGTRCMKNAYSQATNNSGRCNNHGGCVKGAKKGNKNAVKHGIYETIWVDQLEDEEQQYYSADIDKIKEIDAEIKLCNIRINRQLKKQNEYEGERMLLVLKDHKTKHDSFRLEQIETYCEQLEESITKLQVTIGKLIETKHKLEIETNVIDDQAEENRKAFIKAAMPTDDLFDDFNNDDTVD